MSNAQAALGILLICVICIYGAGMAFLGFTFGKKIRILELHKHDYIVQSGDSEEDYGIEKAEVPEEER